MTLMQNLVSVFDKMEKDADGDNKTFAEGIVDAIIKSFESGNTVGTVYMGSISLGTVAGTVVGNSIMINGSKGRSDAIDIIMSACDDMNDSGAGDNTTWIDAVVDACTAIVTADDTVSEVLVGTAVPPAVPPPTVPVGGTGVGTFNDSVASPVLKLSLMAIPSAMELDPGNASIMADLMSKAILIYFQACICNLKSEGVIEGLDGVNVMVGNL